MAVEAKVRIVGENATSAAFASILNDAEALSGKLKAAFGAAFIGFSAAGLFEGVKGAIEYGDAIAKAAEKSGAAVEQFSQLAYAAKLSNIDIDTLSAGVKKMQQAVAASSPAFTALGIDLEKFRALPLAQQMEVLAEAVKRLPDPIERAGELSKIFGRNWTTLIPLLDKGAEGIQKLREESDSLGQTLSGETAKSLEDSEVAIKRATAAWEKMWRMIAEKLSPAVRLFAQTYLESVGAISEAQRLQDQIVSRQIRLGGFLQFDSEGTKARLRAEIAKFQADLAGLAAKAGGTAQATLAGVLVGTPIANDAAFAAFEMSWSELYNKIQERRFKTVAEHEKFLKGLKDAELAAQVQFADRLDAADKATETSVEKQLDTWTKFYADLKLLRANTGLTDEEAKRRTAEFLDTLLPNMEVKTKERYVQYKKGVDQMLEYAQRGAQGMQQAFANFFFDPMGVGLNGLLLDFVNVIRQMIAEAAAAKLANALGFGSGGGGDKGGWLGSLLGSLFGGGGAAGGAAGGGASAAMNDLAFAGGGSFTVGGIGGTDSQRVGFRATPGEMVSISKPGQGQGGGPVIHITTTIDARGATTELAAALPGILRRNNEAVKADILDGLRRRRYPV